MERLKEAGYEDVGLRSLKKGFEVYIGQGELKKHPELMTKACEVLKRMHEEAVNEDNKKRAQRIAMAMTNLNCQDPPKAHGQNKPQKPTPWWCRGGGDLNPGPPLAGTGCLGLALESRALDLARPPPRRLFLLCFSI